MRIPLCFTQNFRVAVTRTQILRSYETLQKGVLKMVTQFVVFKPLSYCLEEKIGFHVKASFASRPVSRLIR